VELLEKKLPKVSLMRIRPINLDILLKRPERLVYAVFLSEFLLTLSASCKILSTCLWSEYATGYFFGLLRTF